MIKTIDVDLDCRESSECFGSFGRKTIRRCGGDAPSALKRSSLNRCRIAQGQAKDRTCSARSGHRVARASRPYLPKQKDGRDARPTLSLALGLQPLIRLPNDIASLS